METFWRVSEKSETCFPFCRDQVYSLAQIRDLNIYDPIDIEPEETVAFVITRTLQYREEKRTFPVMVFVKDGVSLGWEW